MRFVRETNTDREMIGGGWRRTRIDCIASPSFLKSPDLLSVATEGTRKAQLIAQIFAHLILH